jgi:hypothetical protein
MATMSYRVVLNRAALDEARLGVADGMAKMGEDIVADAKTHIHNITGKLSKSGDYGVWVDNRKVAAGKANKPKNTPSRGIILAVGFGAPQAHLVEFGTSGSDERLHTFRKGTRKGKTVMLRAHKATRAKPFLTPAVMRRVRGIPDYVRPAVAARMRRAGIV